MASADFSHSNSWLGRSPLVRAFSFLQFLRHLLKNDLVIFGRCNDVLTNPRSTASYAIPVRQYRILPFGFLQCIPRCKPPCHLLMLPGVTPAHKGLTPSGLSFIQRTLLNLPFKAHTMNLF
ncbi:hypothetical protein ES703_27712 [subsurface metagenome]